MLEFGRTLVVIGLVVTTIGAFLWLGARFGLPLGRLPGDLVIRRGSFTVYAPLATSLVVSVVLSFIVYFLRK